MLWLCLGSRQFRPVEVLLVFCPLRFAETQTRTTAVLVDELDAGRSRRRFFDETNVSTYIVQKTIIWVRSDKLGQPITTTAFNSTGILK